MSLEHNTVFKLILSQVTKDLNTHKNTKQEVLETCINNRLDKCYREYEKELNVSIQNLSNQKNTTLLKRL